MSGSTRASVLEKLMRTFSFWHIPQFYTPKRRHQTQDLSKIRLNFWHTSIKIKKLLGRENFTWARTSTWVKPTTSPFLSQPDCIRDFWICNNYFAEYPISFQRAYNRDFTASQKLLLNVSITISVHHKLCQLPTFNLQYVWNVGYVGDKIAASSRQCSFNNSALRPHYAHVS